MTRVKSVNASPWISTGGVKLLDDREALLLALVRDKAHVGAQRCLLRDDIVRVGAGLRGKGDGGLQHRARLRADGREDGL